MAKFQIKIFEDVLQRMINRLVTRSTLTDLNETAAAKTVLAGTAREIDEIYFQLANLLQLFSLAKAEGDDLDARVKDISNGQVTRRTSVKATGSVIMSRAASGPLLAIPAGVRIEVPGVSPALVVVTTAASSIPNLGTSSAAIPCTAEQTGAYSNAAAGTLTKFKGARPAGVNSVTNPATFTGGRDKESDDSLRARCAAYIATLARSTLAALEFAAGTVELVGGQRVVFAAGWEDPITLGKTTLYIDDGAGTAETTANNTGVPENLTSGVDFPGDIAQGGEQYLYSDNKPIKRSAGFILRKNAVALVETTDFTLNEANGQFFLLVALAPGDVVDLEYTWFTGLIQETQKVIDGDKLDRANYPGYRAAGTRTIVAVPSIVSPTFTGFITVDTDAGFEEAAVIAAAVNATISHVNGLGIGADIKVAKIIEVVMLVPGVFDFTLTVPSANVTIPFDQLARIDTGNVTYT